MAYKSKYEERLSDALDRMTNREKFNYDFNADPMYQMYKDQYTKLGNEAAQNAAANVSALTGGYGNSYAATAAAQANQQYLTKLNEQIPALYENALRKYQMEGNDLKDAYSALGDAENREYSKYRDEVADNQWREQFDYGKERDKVSDEQWQKNFDQALRQFDESIRQYNENMAYNKERASVADQQWLDQFNYGKERDAVSDAQWREQFDYGKSRDAASDAQWREQFDYGKSRDSISDEQWLAQFNENNRRYNQEWDAEQAAQAAALALAQQRLNSKDKDKDEEIPSISKELQDEITKTAAMAHQSSASEPQTAMASFGRYLDGLVDKKKITEEQADEIMIAYKDEESKRHGTKL